MIKLVEFDGTFADWRMKARGLLSERIHFNSVQWSLDPGAMSFGEPWSPSIVDPELRIPKAFLDEAELASAFADTDTFSLLYRLSWKLAFENRKILEDPGDADVLKLNSHVRLVRRDIHKMKAFVRFRETEFLGDKIYYAWHRPDYRIVRLAAPFFRDRFNGMNWVIMTEHECASWNGIELSFSEGVSADALPKDDDAEDLWKTYYASVFNPARIKIKAMKKELPVRHWKTLPEAELISSLLQEAPDRLKAFYDSQLASTAATLELKNLEALNAALSKCQACGICPQATAPVPGAGSAHSRIMFVGEQPGDEEDKAGAPFVGPAGKLFNNALIRAGIKREDTYVTNAIKGFKWIDKNHIRWHRSANGREIATCRPWLQQEIALVNPEFLVCLGRSAAQSILGKLIRIEEMRGKFFKTAYSSHTLILPHPAAILRAGHQKEEQFERFVIELKLLT